MLFGGDSFSGLCQGLEMKFAGAGHLKDCKLKWCTWG